jgi:carboxylesterase
MVHPNSANIFYEESQSEIKEIKWYEESGHVITLDKERNQLHEDVYRFLEKLDWEE